MPDIPTQATAVDDVRRVRERLDRESGGDIRRHIAETNRLFEQLRTKIGVNAAPMSRVVTHSKSANG